MEIAELVLKYIQVLIWPLMIAAFLFSFRRELKLALHNIAKGKEFEIEIAGQKLKVNLLEKGFEDVSNKVKEIEQAETEELQKIGTNIRQDVEVLTVASRLTPLEIRFLAKFYASDELLLSQVASKYEGIPEALIAKGLMTVIPSDNSLTLTKTGDRILEWIVASSIT